MFPFHKIQAGTMCSVWGLASYKGVGNDESSFSGSYTGCWSSPSQRPGSAQSVFRQDEGEPGLGRNSQGPSLQSSCPHSYRRKPLPDLLQKATFLKMKKSLLSFLNLLLS